VASVTDPVKLFHWKGYLAHRLLALPGLVSPSQSQGTLPQYFSILQWKSLGNTFNDRDLISVLGPSPSGEASERLSAPPGGPVEGGRRLFRLCQAPPGGSTMRCSFVNATGEGVRDEVGGHSGHSPGGAPHVSPVPRTLRGSSRTAPSGLGWSVVSSEFRGIPPQCGRPLGTQESRLFGWAAPGHCRGRFWTSGPSANLSRPPSGRPAGSQPAPLLGRTAYPRHRRGRPFRVGACRRPKRAT